MQEGFVRRAKLMGVDIDASSSKALQESFGKVEDADTAMCLELMKRKAMST
jgi:protein SSD1